MASGSASPIQGREYFGKLEGDTVAVPLGQQFAGPEANVPGDPPVCRESCSRRARRARSSR